MPPDIVFKPESSVAQTKPTLAPGNREEAFAKRLMDLAVAVTGLFCLVPLFVVIAIAIRIETPGPVLFRQVRKGLKGQPFRIFKFRTMSVLEDGPSVRHATRNDPRVTRVGRIL